jgi:hypothetical protein
MPGRVGRARQSFASTKLGPVARSGNRLRLPVGRPLPALRMWRAPHKARWEAPVARESGADEDRVKVDLAGGRVFALYYKDESHLWTLYARDARTGRLLWATKFRLAKRCRVADCQEAGRIPLDRRAPRGARFRDGSVAWCRLVGCPFLHADRGSSNVRCAQARDTLVLSSAGRRTGCRDLRTRWLGGETSWLGGETSLLRGRRAGWAVTDAG